MAWSDGDVMRFHMGQAAVADQMTSDDDYGTGAPSIVGTVVSGIEGRIGLGILSVAILGVMFFYISTRSRQF